MGSAPIHILLVEDDEDHAELIRLGFESRGRGMVLAIARSLEEARARPTAGASSCCRAPAASFPIPWCS